MAPMDPVDVTAHRRQLMEQLSGDVLVAVLSGDPIPKSADEDYPYTPHRNYLYLTGSDRPRQCLLMARRGGEVTEWLFIEPPNPHRELWNGRMMTEDEARERSGIRTIRPFGEFRRTLNRLLQSGRYAALVLDLEHRQWDELPGPGVRFAGEVSARHPGVPIRNLYPDVAALRRVKSEPEIARIQAAVDHTHEGFTALIAGTVPGRYEYQLEAEFQRALRFGGVVPAYSSIVATGVNATVMHYVTLRDQVERGQLVLVDAAAEFDYYKSDITRTFPVDGKFSARQAAVYDIVFEASRETIHAMRPGVPHAELNRVTRKILARGLRSLNLIRDDDELDRYYYYNVSHYLGLDTHDVGVYDELEPGMVMTVEPGLYIGDEAIGVRIEDDVAVTASGARVLSEKIPAERQAVEAWVEAARGAR